MSMKLIVISTRLTMLLIAGSMIGCGSPESNSTAASGGGESPGFSAGQRSGGGLVSDESTARSSAATSGETDEARAAPTVLFVGTSLTAGLGVPIEDSFPMRIEARLADAGLDFRVVNAGVSGETSSGALSRIDWLLRQPHDVIVLETGANDMLRGIDPATTERNIQAIIDRIREQSPDTRIVLAGMLALPNLGAAYAREFEAIYPRLAERNELPFVPFLLEGVGGERQLNQDDGVHPTAEGHRRIAETVWKVLEPVLEDVQAANG